MSWSASLRTDATAPSRRGGDQAYLTDEVLDIAETCLANTHSLKPKTVASYQSLLSSRVLPALGPRQLRTLKPSHVESWIGAMVAKD